MTTYRTHDVPVRGGTLRVGAWQGDGPVSRVVLAAHGITASHLNWALVAEQVPAGTLLLAPDLRGRGRSNLLPPPYGMASHAEDCARVLDDLADGRCDLAVGHSMGCFVLVMFAATYPERVGDLLLIDGGVPLVLPPDVDLDTARTVGLGPASDRLAMTFPDRAAYREFWRVHPAFRHDWTSAVVAYVDYDLDPGGPPFRSSCSTEAMRADFAEQFVGGPVDRAWPDVRASVTLLRAPRGLQDEPGGLYPPDRLDAWLVDHPQVVRRDVADVNHYTITLGAKGAEAVVPYLGATGQAVSMAG